MKVKNLEVTVVDDTEKGFGIEIEPDAKVIRAITILKLAIKKLNKEVKRYSAWQLNEGLDAEQVKQLLSELDFEGLNEFRKGSQ